MTTTVTNQKELDAAVSAGETHIIIQSPKGVWLRVATPRSTRVEAWESSSVVARESSSVVAWGSSSVEAWESSSVVARESSSVVARESSSVVAWGSSSVEAWESSSVVARGSSSVVAWGSSSVVAWGSSSVEAWESSSVVARESSSVHARQAAKVSASAHVAVHLHSARAVVEGGTVIDVIDIDKDAEGWCEFHGVTVVDGIATVYKAVDDQWTTDRGFDYSPGATPEAPDWRRGDSCGGGLHFGPTPRHSRNYFPGATRYVAVGVAIADLQPITGSGTAKCKAPRVVTPCAEVDINGKPVVREVATA